MLRTTLAAAIALGASLSAQIFPTNTPPDTPADAPSRFVPGLDIQGRIDPWFLDFAHGSTRAISMSTTACNVGSVLGIWERDPDPDHPFIAQLYCRLRDHRFEQISDWSFVKHGFSSSNLDGCGLGCASSPGGNRLGINCSDTYGAYLNAWEQHLGPPWEVNPFTGEWSMVSSHFDRGFPPVLYPQNIDGVRSPITTFDDVRFRCAIPASATGSPNARYFAQCQYLHKWEPEGSRENNLSSLEIVIGNPLSSPPVPTTATGSILYGTVLQRYAGARVESAANVDGNGAVRDGRFYVAVHVTPLPDGWYHYEYAVHNRDNHGRNGAFEVPLCAAGRYRNTGFEDVDSDPFDDWSVTRLGDALRWDAPANNAQPWNTIYNFWFDADAAPEAGTIGIVQASPQPGAHGILRIPSDVPTLQANVHVAAGCGGPTLWPTQQATIPAPLLGLRLDLVGAGAACGVLLSDGLQLVPVPSACLFMLPDLDVALQGTAAGTTALMPLGIPNDPGLEGVDLFLQGVELQLGGALLGIADLSNVVRMRIGNTTTGCP